MNLAFHLIVLILCSTYAHSQKLSLEQVLAKSLTASPTAKEVIAQYELARADALEFKQLSNPVVSTEVGIPYDYPAERGDNEVEVKISQSIRAGDLGFGSSLRSDISKAIEKVKDLETKIELTSLLNQISLLYCKLWAAQEERGHLKVQKKHADDLLQIAESAGSQGRIDPAEGKIVSATAIKIAADLIGIDYSIQNLKAKLARLSGLDFSEIQTIRPSLIELPSFVEILELVRQDPKGLIEKAKLTKNLASKRKSLASREAWSKFVPSLSYSRDEGGTDYVGLGLSFELPFFKRNQAGKLKSESELKTSRAWLEYFNGKVFESELKSIYLRAKARSEQAKTYMQKVVPAYDQALSYNLQAFQAGQNSVFQLWKTQLEYHQTLDYSTELWVQAFAAVLDLEILVGDLNG